MPQTLNFVMSKFILLHNQNIAQGVNKDGFNQGAGGLKNDVQVMLVMKPRIMKD